MAKTNRKTTRRLVLLALTADEGYRRTVLEGIAEFGEQVVDWEFFVDRPGVPPPAKLRLKFDGLIADPASWELLTKAGVPKVPAVTVTGDPVPNGPPAVIADSSTNRRLVARLTTYASVVLPVPGGPHRITDAGPAGPPLPSPTSLRSGEPGRRRCCWPTTSSRVRGRIRTASGLAPGSFSWRSSAAAVKRSGSTDASVWHACDSAAGRGRGRQSRVLQ